MDLEDGEAKELIRPASSAGVLVRIGWPERHHQTGPIVQSCRFQLDAEDFAEIVADPVSGRTRLRLLRPDHPLLTPWVQPLRDEGIARKHPSEYLGKMGQPERGSLLGKVLESVADVLADTAEEGYQLTGRGDALPAQGVPLQLAIGPSPWVGVGGGGTRVRSSAGLSRCGSRGPGGGGPLNDPTRDFGLVVHVARETGTLLSGILTGIVQCVRKRLRDFRYLGPVREIPARSATRPRTPDLARWSIGLGAWDRLHDCDEELVQEVSDWLSDSAHFNAGVSLKRRELVFADQTSGYRKPDARKEVDLRASGSPTERRLFIVPNDSEIELSLYDVGIGLSQLVPVLVTALDKQYRLAAIEQPERHLHPKFQAELGDLFIEAALGERRQPFLLETHSEHLILRLLRRIRETTAGKNTSTPPITPNGVRGFFSTDHTQCVDVRREIGFRFDSSACAPLTAGSAARRNRSFPEQNSRGTQCLRRGNFTARSA